MEARFKCKFCGKNLKAEDSLSKVQCPYCKNIIERFEEFSEKEQQNNIINFAANYVPSWGTSVVMHLAMVLIFLMASWTSAMKPPDVEYTADIIRQDNKKIVRNETSNSSSRTTFRKVDNPGSFVYNKSLNPTPDLFKNNLTAVDVLGLGGGGRDIGGIEGWGEGRGNGLDDSWFGEGGGKNYKNIVYVIDRSGSMTDTIMHVKYELRKSIKSMSPSQKFYIVFYSSGPSVGMPSGKLVPAIEQNKELAYEFIDSMTPFGQTDPSDALKKAFQMSPDVIHLLTDGEFDKSIISLIDNYNKDKNIPINTYCFVYTPGEYMLQEIARKSKGSYKYIAEADVLK
jgi:phage FluMu protein Com